MQEFLPSPLDIGPKSTKMGSLSYLVPLGLSTHLGGPDAFKGDLLLEASDYVSGKVQRIPVPTDSA
jgi:hypothetical protein